MYGLRIQSINKIIKIKQTNKYIEFYYMGYKEQGNYKLAKRVDGKRLTMAGRWG